MPSFKRRTNLQPGFTLVEALVGIAVLSLLAAAAYGAMLSANRQAMVNRLYTLAESNARDQLDRLLTVAPFNPQNPASLGGAQVPAELVLDSSRGGPLVEDIPLYTDPKTNVTLVTARRTTSVTDAGNYNARAIRVQMDFQFISRSHQVVLNTLRTSDSP